MQAITKIEFATYLSQLNIKDEPMIFLIHPDGTECSVEVGKDNKYTLYGCIGTETVYEQEINTQSYNSMIRDVVDKVWIEDSEVDVLATIWIVNQRQLSSKDKCKVATEQLRRRVRDSMDMSLVRFCDSTFDKEKSIIYTRLVRYIQHKTGTILIDAPELHNVTNAQADHYYLIHCIKVICTMYTNAFQ